MERNWTNIIMETTSFGMIQNAFCSGKCLSVSASGSDEDKKRKQDLYCQFSRMVIMPVC